MEETPKQKAYRILELNPCANEVTPEQIKKQYRLLALKYHPDKNKEKDACIRFQEINEAYQLLNGKTNNIDDEPSGKFNVFLQMFLSQIFKNDKHAKLMMLIIDKIFAVCETKSLAYLEKIDIKILESVQTVLTKYQSVFHISNEYLNRIREIIDKKYKCEKNMESEKGYIECILLHPLLSDILDANVYKLIVEGETYMVPLWFDELVYDTPLGEILVNCIPVLPEGYVLTENGDLHFPLDLKVEEIWGKEEIEKSVGDRNIKIPVGNIVCGPKEQYIETMEKGIPIMNHDDIYSINRRGKIIANISLHLS